MAQEIFGFYYAVGSGLPPNDITLEVVNNGPTTLIENDGDINGMTTVGGTVTWEGSDSTLLGFTAAGDPIIDWGNFGPPFIYVFSNDGGLALQTLGTTDSGTYAYCFCAGTCIATLNGDREVEALEIGDRVLTLDDRAVRVKWLGLQTVRRFLSGPHMQPVCIRAGALGDGLPHSDLTVTADHGMIVDGLVINASALVNGSSIDWVPMSDLPDRVIYYHIETENHDVILANGAAAETFVDYAGRQAFDNYAEYVELYGAERIIPEMDRIRISARRLLPEHIKARLGIVELEMDWDAALSA